jgi:lysophospholipase L1-like esterase
MAARARLERTKVLWDAKTRPEHSTFRREQSACGKRTPETKQVVRQGKSHLFSPEPPALKPGEKRIANIFVDYHCDGTNPEMFPLTETPNQARTVTTPGRIPKTMAKIKAGKPVTIVSWGDSVTVGGDASDRNRTRYVKVFEHRIKEKFPNADITVETVAVGGSNSRQWLYPERYDVNANPRVAQCRWDLIEEARPDLVTIEFVNDSGLRSQALFDPVYDDILDRLRKLGAEVILITPHFTMPGMMGFKHLREKEKRGYVLNLRRYAEEHGLAVADASARWEHLWREGIPYVTLLRNGINHPDDRGHALFADELMKCFTDS